MSREYWLEFWSRHGKRSTGDSRQCQVLRTINGVPVPESTVTLIAESIKTALGLSQGDRLLDLCCGNGELSTRLSPSCRSVMGVDCSLDLLEQIDRCQYPNIEVLQMDIVKAEFAPATFDKIVLYAGVQYFSERDLIQLFQRIAIWLTPGGRFFAGDVPDADRIWKFHNNLDREKAYFESVVKQMPIIGVWYQREWLMKMGRYAGFEKCEIMEQPVAMPYSHYRYDALFVK